MRSVWLMVLALLGLVACSAPRPMITISQPLIMDSTLLSAGIIADSPQIDHDIPAVATTTVYNDRDTPIQLHYQYYWYDKQGLAVDESQSTQTINLPGNSHRDIVSTAGNPSAEQVRIYIHL